MIDLGKVRPGSTLRIPFSSFDKDDGSSVTMTNFAVADILVYKDGNTAERASTSGYTATTDFDAKTGKHLAIIDLADNTTAGFWNAGSEYLVAVDAVTIDGVTTGGWIARFSIGYDSSWFDTTIATLASQTSFTLTSGPAEDDALNDHWVIIHDIASAVQCGKALILDYTGATKTVTLAAGTTFAAAAGDNISIMGPTPLQPATLGRKLVVDAAGLADANAVKVGPTGAGTAQTAGDIPARLPAALVGGRMDSSVGAMANNVLTAAAVNADALTAAKIAADVGAEIAAAVRTELAVELGRVDATISSRLAAAGYTAPDNATIAAIAGFVDTEVAAILAAVDTEVAAIKAKTDQLVFTVANRVDANALQVGDKSGYSLTADFRIKKNTALGAFVFVMVDAADVPATGLAVTAQRSIDGGALAACANAVAEISNGLYKIDLAASDLNGDTIALRFTAAAAKDRVIVLVTQTE